MIKECPVVLNNESVTVIKYGDVDVQFPSIKRNIKLVFVNYDGEKYSIVKENKNVDKPKRKSVSKKTTVKKEY